MKETFSLGLRTYSYLINDSNEDKKASQLENKINNLET